jgi:EAL domain-containing protein (putative c-di-GMP-specific phosphodiesterase class I)
VGGDEFVVLLEDLSSSELEAATQTKSVVEKILEALNQPYQLGAHVCRSTPSIGATLFDGRRQSTEELLKQADIAMYQSKKSGRNTQCFFDSKMQEAIKFRANLEIEMIKALEGNQFQLHYQIQVGESQAGGSQRAIGAEALIRWKHPGRGQVSPAEFIPLAEDTGIILPIGQWVLDTACAQIKKWQQDDQTRSLVLAVNVSAKQFRQSDFVGRVSGCIQHHAINPSLLKLELTESLLLEDINDTIATMNQLMTIGVQFSLDDFGTGYSSLQYLKRLPFGQLKIDQSFVRDIGSSDSDRAIVKTIIAMAHSLNLNVIAEGVETQEQLKFLLKHGCTHFQGYLFGKPLPIEEFEASLRKV